MKIYYCVLLLILILSCQRNSELIYEPPKFMDSLYLEPHILNDTFIMDLVEKVLVYKDYLILSTRLDDYQFHIFDKRNGQYLNRFASIGRGPGEVMMLETVELNQMNGNLLAVSSSSKKAIAYNIDSVMFSDSLFYKDISFENLPSNVDVRVDAIYWDDTNCIIHSSSYTHPEYRLTKWNTNGQLLNIYSEYPADIYPPFPPALFGNFALKCFSPNGKLFVEAMKLGDVMEIFDVHDTIQSRVIKRFHKPEIIFEDNLITTPDNAVRGFKDITSTNKRIYGIYQGDRHYYWSKNIAEFDWDGNPLKLYHTDYDLWRMCIDEENHRIYAITKNKNREPIIVYFNLPEDES